jgi:hypothetical protein
MQGPSPQPHSQSRRQEDQAHLEEEFGIALHVVDLVLNLSTSPTPWLSPPKCQNTPPRLRTPREPNLGKPVSDAELVPQVCVGHIRNDEVRLQLRCHVRRAWPRALL